MHFQWIWGRLYLMFNLPLWANLLIGWVVVSILLTLGWAYLRRK